MTEPPSALATVRKAIRLVMAEPEHDNALNALTTLETELATLRANALDPNRLDDACAAYLAEVEGMLQSGAQRLWQDWRLKPAEAGDKAAIEALEEDRRAMRAALAAAIGRKG